MNPLAQLAAKHPTFLAVACLLPTAFVAYMVVVKKASIQRVLKVLGACIVLLALYYLVAFVIFLP